MPAHVLINFPLNKYTYLEKCHYVTVQIMMHKHTQNMLRNPIIEDKTKIIAVNNKNSAKVPKLICFLPHLSFCTHKLTSMTTRITYFSIFSFKKNSSLRRQAMQWSQYRNFLPNTYKLRILLSNQMCCNSNWNSGRRYFIMQSM